MSFAARASARAFFYNPHQVGLNIGRTAKSKWDEPFALKNQVIVENTIVQVGIKLPEWNGTRAGDLGIAYCSVRNQSLQGAL